MNYYPFGLTMAGISSKAALGLENRYKYNGIEFNNDLDLNTYEAFYRNLDPQTGRWWQVDPETENMEMWSPYASNYDNPILYQNPRGNEGEACCGGILKLGEDALKIYRAVRNGEKILDAAKNNDITWKSVINGIGDAIQFDQGGVIKLPASDPPKTIELIQPPDTYVLIQPADTKAQGVIYEVPGSHTKSGKPYIGRTKHSDPAKRKSDGGRDRKQAKVVDKYDPNNIHEGRVKEQGKIDEKGLDNLDNKRNEIKPPKPPEPPKPPKLDTPEKN